MFIVDLNKCISQETCSSVSESLSLHQQTNTVHVVNTVGTATETGREDPDIDREDPFYGDGQTELRHTTE